MNKQILVLNGPNLNMLGKREPEIYGFQTLEDVEKKCKSFLPDGISLSMKQSNYEGQLINWIQEERDIVNGIVINPGGLSHTSVALLDALNLFDGPVIEVHVSNIHQRESFRHFSYVSRRANGIIIGLGIEGYEAAVRRICNLIHA